MTETENTAAPAISPELLATIEALLFATDTPLGLDKLVSLSALKDRKAARAAIEELRAHYEADGRAFTVVEFGGGYSISTLPEYAALVRKLFKGRRKQRLSRAGLEALAIVAYKQPVTRLEIEEIRGVSASGVLGTLLERDLIQIVGRAETLGHPLLYGTTKTLLDYLGLTHVRELPQLSELEDLLAEREDLKQLASSRGEELAEEDFDRALAEDDEEEVGPADADDLTGAEEDSGEPGESPETLTDPEPEIETGLEDEEAGESEAAAS